MKNKNEIKAKKYITLSLFMLLHRKAYEDISITEICQKAGISRMSFYRYYNSKDDIVINYSDERFAEFFEDIIRYNPSLEELVLGAFYYFKTNYKEMMMLINAKKSHILLAQFTSYSKFIFSKDIIKDLPIINGLSVYVFAGGLLNTILNWIENGLKTTPESMTTMFINNLNSSK